MESFIVKSNITGGHRAFKTSKSTKPFENPMNYYMKAKLRTDDIVADIGGYIGEYAMYAERQGVKKIYCYEPTPESFELLKINASTRNCIIPINKAVVGSNVNNINLYISRGIGVTNSTAKKRNKAHYIKVDAIKYEEALQDANVVKIDVEGAEYSYNIIQPQLRTIILEFHPIEGINWINNANNIMGKIEDSGYRCVLRPKFTCGWDLTGVWER